MYVMEKNKRRVLMVCLGNTCRSPIAEAIFKDYIIKHELSNSWEVDSAGLVDWHVGESPNPRVVSTLQRNGIINYHHEAKLITDDDFSNVDWILAMDESNYDALKRRKPKETIARIELLGSYDPNGEIIIRDPYCDIDCSGFVQAYEQCERSINNFFQIHQTI